MTTSAFGSSRPRQHLPFPFDENKSRRRVREVATITVTSAIPGANPNIAPPTITSATPIAIPSTTQSCRASDQTKLINEMITMYEAKLYRFIMKRIGHHDDAKDITQHTLSEAARVIGDFRGESKLSTWLCGIAMNAIRNYLNRSPHRLYKFETDQDLVEHECHSSDPCTQLEHKRLLISVSEVIANLPEEMSKALILVSVDQMSYEESASLLCIPIGTLRSRVSRARALLRERLERDGIKLPF